jgi:hypothetical protein
MKQEYTISLYWRIFYGAMGTSAIVFSLFLLTKPTNGLIIFPVVFGTGGVVTLINQFKSKLIISDYSIVRTTVFGTKELLRADIKGFRINNKVIVIEPVEAGYSKIKIRDYSSIGNLNNLTSWLRTNLKDLNKEDYEKEKNDIINNANLGYSEGERTDKFKAITRLSGIYNFVGFVLFVLFLFFLRDTSAADAILLVFPLIGISIIYFSKGLVTLISKRNSAYNNVMPGLYLGVLLLVLKSLNYYHITNYDKLTVPSLILGSVILGVLAVEGFNNTYSSRIGQFLLMIIFSAAYAIGVIANVNCSFDKSSAQIYSTTVTDKFISYKHATNYHIRIDSWGDHHEAEYIIVPKSFYYHTSVGSTVRVMEKKGLFKMPWFYVDL